MFLILSFLIHPDAMLQPEEERCFTKERVLRMSLMLAVSVVTKIVAFRMVKKGAKHKEHCPASDAIPDILLGERLIASCHFFSFFAWQH